MFAFVEATDPEIFLRVEAHPAASPPGTLPRRE
jgi:hypothetical protein